MVGQVPTLKETGTAVGLFDLSDHLLFYHSYHANVVNQVIHIACVWPIFWTALVLLHHGPRLCATPSYLPASLAINPALLATVFYVVWYVALEVKNHNSLSGLGLLAAAMAVMSYVTAGKVARWEGVGLKGIGKGAGIPVWKFATGVHVACWVAQFVGHGVFEKRAPALLDNLFQAIFMAPLFVVIEAFFFAGWKPEFRAESQARAMKLARLHRQ